MAQKTSPILLRSLDKCDTFTFQQHSYCFRYVPYVLNEHDSVIFFITNFLRVSNLSLHSFRYSRNYTGTVLILVKYIPINYYVSRKWAINLCFSSLEKAFLQGISKILKDTSVIVSFLNISKLHKNIVLLPQTLFYSRFFSVTDTRNSTQLLLSVKGSAYFLANLISSKLEIMRSKFDRRSQGRLLIFIKTLINFVQAKNLVGIQGLKVTIKGRISGNPRSKIWSVSEGNLSLQKIKNEIDFYYVPSFTVYGTFGIKVWINYG